MFSLYNKNNLCLWGKCETGCFHFVIKKKQLRLFKLVFSFFQHNPPCIEALPGFLSITPWKWGMGNQCLAMMTLWPLLSLQVSNHSLSLTKKTQVFPQHPWKCDRVTCWLINKVNSQIFHNSCQLFHLPFSGDAFNLEVAIMLLGSWDHKSSHAWVSYPQTFLYPQTQPTVITRYVNEWAFRWF